MMIVVYKAGPKRTSDGFNGLNMGINFEKKQIRWGSSALLPGFVLVKIHWIGIRLLSNQRRCSMVWVENATENQSVKNFGFSLRISPVQFLIELGHFFRSLLEPNQKVWSLNLCETSLRHRIVSFFFGEFRRFLQTPSTTNKKTQTKTVSTLRLTTRLLTTSEILVDSLGTSKWGKQLTTISSQTKCSKRCSNEFPTSLRIPTIPYLLHTPHKLWKRAFTFTKRIWCERALRLKRPENVPRTKNTTAISTILGIC